MAEAIKDIEKENEIKAGKINLSWYFLIAGLVTIVVYVTVFILTGTPKK